MKSSTELEIIGVLTAVIKCVQLNLENIVISSDSLGALGFLIEKCHDEVKTKNYKRHLENNQIKKLADSTKKS